MFHVAKTHREAPRSTSFFSMAVNNVENKYRNPENNFTDMLLKIGFHPPVADGAALQGVDLRFSWMEMHLSVTEGAK